MSSVVALAVSAVFLIVACSPEAGEAPTGSHVEAAASAFDAAPDFEIELFGNENTAKGEVLRLSQFKGQPVVVNFWYPSCPPCRLEMPHFEAASKQHREVQFVGVQLLGLDTAEDGQNFIDENGVTYAVGPDPDGSIVADFKVIGFPTTAFLNREHEIVRTWAGALNEEKLGEIIQQDLLD